MFSNQLVMRDPAKAAAFGISRGKGQGRTNFGWDDMAGDFGDEMMGDFGGDFGAAAVVQKRAQTMHPARQQAILHHHLHKQNKTQKREALLYPNEGSDEKVGRFIFPLNATLTLGTAATASQTQTPDTPIRPQRVQVNAPQVGFFAFSQLKIGNVDVIIGGNGTVDAFFWAAITFGTELDLPTMQTQTKGTFAGNYSGIVPAGYLAGQPFPFTVAFSGPASVTPEGRH